MNFTKLSYEIVQGIRSELLELSQALHAHPEVAFEEVFAKDTQIKLLQKWGFAPQAGVYDMETAFVADGHGDNNGKVFAFCSEYDARPGIGHGCGHNLIATMALGAFFAADKILRDCNLPGQVRLFGTPGEESSGGKVFMSRKNCLDDVDAVMMVHPASQTQIDPGSTSIRRYGVTFHGKSAHAAASPELGINAMDAVMMLINGLTFMRQQLPEHARIHTMVTDSGLKLNIIPEKASCSVCLRSASAKWDEIMGERLKNMIKGAELMTGATAEVTTPTPGYKSRKPNRIMNNMWMENMKTLGIETLIPEHGGRGSSDFGDFSRIRPGIHPYLGITTGIIPVHSSEFAAAAISEQAFEQALKGAAAMAAISLQFLSDPKLQADIKAEFDGAE